MNQGKGETRVPKPQRNPISTGTQVVALSTVPNRRWQLTKETVTPSLKDITFWKRDSENKLSKLNKILKDEAGYGRSMEQKNREGVMGHREAGHWKPSWGEKKLLCFINKATKVKILEGK